MSLTRYVRPLVLAVAAIACAATSGVGHTSSGGGSPRVANAAPQRGGNNPRVLQGDALGVPRNLRAQDLYQGRPWRGAPGRVERVVDLMAREAQRRGPLQLRVGRDLDSGRRNVGQNPAAPAVSRWPAPGSLAAETTPDPRTPQTVSTQWTAIHASQSGSVPPDAVGDVGPSQVFAAANGRFRTFDKSGTIGSLDVTDTTFFTSVSGGQGLSDPRVTYDRLSGRWFVSEITTNEPNRILIAVSSGSTITSASSFTFFQFQNDTVGTTPNVDTGGFADYDTLGVDANALYLGVVMFNTDAQAGYAGSTGFVVNKADLLAGSLTVTAFRQLSARTGAGVYVPQGVMNDNPSATEGYFIGVDNAAFSLLQIRRVTTPGGTPSISGNLSLTVPSTYAPLPQLAMGASRRLDSIDDRLFAAMIRRNTLTGVSSLWTGHNIGVNGSGVGASNADRNAMRWYQIDGLTGTPALTQSGTIAAAGSTPRGYWMGSVAANGQGDMALITNIAGLNEYAGVATIGRLSGDTLGTTRAVNTVAEGAGGYNDWTDAGAHPVQRWGDYSRVVVDPADNMTMWAFADIAHSTSTTDAWGVRVVKLLAQPPATPDAANPSNLASVSSANVTITGVSSSGSGFYDPGAGFPSRLAVSVSGGITVNSVTFVNPTTITINVSTVGASGGLHNVTVTNPDGQQLTGIGLISTDPPPTINNVSPSSGSTAGGTRLTITGTNYVIGGTTVSIGGVAATNVVVASTTSLTAFTPASSAGAKTVTVTTVAGPGSASNGFTYFVSLFTDDPLQAGLTAIKAVHVAELRSYITTLRGRYGMGPFSYTDPALSAGSSRVTAQHIIELRESLATVYAAAGLTPPTYTDPVITPGTTTIKTIHLTEIRAAIVAIY